MARRSAAAPVGPHPEARAGTVSGLLAYTIWGLLTLFWHALSGLDALGLIGWRIVTSALLLGVALAVTRQWAAVGRVLADRRLLARTAAAAVALAVNWTTYVWCVTHDRVVDTALGYFLAPIGVVLTGVLVLGEPLRRAQGVALALAGVAVVVLAAGYGAPPTYAIAIAASWTIYGLLKKTVPLRPLEGLAAETLVLAPFAVTVLVVLQVRGEGALAGATTLQLVLVALTGVVTAVPLLLFAHAAQRVRMAELGWLQYVVPTINLALGVLVYDEAMPAWRIAGFALVWVALAISTVDAVRTARADRTAADVVVAPLEG